MFIEYQVGVYPASNGQTRGLFKMGVLAYHIHPSVLPWMTDQRDINAYLDEKHGALKV